MRDDLDLLLRYAVHRAQQTATLLGHDYQFRRRLRDFIHDGTLRG